MNWQSAIGLIANAALLVPVVLILLYRLYRYNSYLALMVYCLLAFSYSLMTNNYIKAPRDFERNWGIINNLIDVPLMLLFLMLFSTGSAQKNRIKIYMAVYILYELVILYLYGVTVRAIVITLGPGVALIFLIALYFFIQKVKISFVNNKAVGKACLAAAITFAYGCFAFIYIMHYIIAIDAINSMFLIYNFVTIVYTTLLVIGLSFENKRNKKREELLQTRKELVQFFSDEQTAANNRNKSNKWEWKILNW